MTTGFPMANTVRDNLAHHRFEMDLGDSVAVANYTELPGALAINHTEVPSQHGGQGIGSEPRPSGAGQSCGHAVWRYTCRAARSSRVLHSNKHPEYNDLLAVLISRRQRPAGAAIGGAFIPADPHAQSNVPRLTAVRSARYGRALQGRA